ncbi:bidirectional sugar transporter SWEET14-like isoform X1 [Lycium ferocissimum]|uniref:bidirectional sugar transporter SWEET14-like isoform X1 n=1 Tax=Lycium ferocissimum TaxID=112874 RepID=UPI0028165E4D|nr:bidirectional sugar transporter SWEET14-like isoform X1 [Lycium ferocissimum]
MTLFNAASHWANVFGILGNIVSFLVFLSPLLTFYRIFKRKSTEGFQSVPYSVSLFSAMLYLYYAFLKGDVNENGTLLITINSFGIAVEVIYLAIFMRYATREAKIYTTKLILLFNIASYGAIVGLTYMLGNSYLRLVSIGWICAIFSVCVFAAPLSIMRRVIRTNSVEFMPFPLSFCLTICAIMWFFYGLLMKDLYIAMPNILGFLFGIAQMVLYTVYRNRNKNNPNEDASDIEAVVVESQENAAPTT